MTEPVDVPTNYELMRAVGALTEAVRDLTKRIDRLGTEYVRREMFDLRAVEVDRRLEENGEATANNGADLARLRRETSERQQSTRLAWMPALVVSLISGSIAVGIAVFMHAR